MNRERAREGGCPGQEGWPPTGDTRKARALSSPPAGLRSAWLCSLFSLAPGDLSQPIWAPPTDSGVVLLFPPGRQPFFAFLTLRGGGHGHPMG